MLTRIVLDDQSVAELSGFEVLALEYLVYDHLSEAARRRRSGDTALLLAIKAAEFLAPLVASHGDAGCDELLAAVRASATARAAIARADQILRLVAPDAA